MSPSLLLFVLICATASVSGQSDMDRKAKFERLVFTTPAYQQEALKLILIEANHFARELQLPELLPITESNVIASYFTPPRMAQGLGAIGNITTSNYTYYVSVGGKLSFVEKHFADVANKDYAQLKSRYLWPTARMDTNAAYQLATQFFAAASVDLKALSRDCFVSIDAFTPEGKGGAHFVPLYWISWKAKGNGATPTATIELLLPTKSLRQMRVNESKYILRSPVVFTNLAELLSQTNAPTMTNGLPPPK